MRAPFVCFALLAVVCCSLSTASVTFNKPVQIADGVLVTGGHELRRHSATWSLFVVFDAPQLHIDWMPSLARIHRAIDTLVAVYRATNSTRDSWLQRLRDIELTIVEPAPFGSPRARRGLLDIGGDLLNKLFGTATEHQVAECRQWIQRVRTTNQRVVHTVNNLITVVNHTYGIMHRNRQHIRDIERYISNLEQHISAWLQGRGRDIERRVDFLDACQRIDESIASLTSVHAVWLRDLIKFQRQRASVEAGRLTEVILPPKELIEIVRAGHKLGFSAPPIAWFYGHVRIVPMWKDGLSLVFTADLPLTENVKYLRYFFWTWPIANAKGYTVQLQVPDNVAYDTQSGDMFIPQSCVGNNPSVCISGPIYNEYGLLCPRGILTNKISHRKQCFVTVRRHVPPEYAIRELKAGMFAVLSQGEEYHCYCPGKPGVIGHLTTGLYVFTVQPGCRISGTSWTLRGHSRRSSKVNYDLAVIDILPINLSHLILPNVLQYHFNTPVWKALPVIHNIKLAKLSELPSTAFTSISWDTYQRHLPWLNFALVSILIVFGVVGVYLLLKQPQLFRTKRRDISNVPHPALSLSPLAPVGSSPPPAPALSPTVSTSTV